jgi:signal peptidase I
VSQKAEPKFGTKDVLEIILYIFLGYLIATAANKGFSYALDSDYPVVAVVSGSMERFNEDVTYYEWLYNHDVTQEQIGQWPFDHGLRKGDIVVVKGVPFEELQPGDVIVYKFPNREPIIHRIVAVEDDALYTKGDNNLAMDQENGAIAPPVTEEYVQGKAIFHMPLLGYVKIAYMTILG